ncbi:RNA-binding protein 48 isoform X2 [Chamaea fasciata]|uniref:RNA-binding protein 48 isoform X2 n=1 Tax=Chamaea fasciata TaxID=190680 RepID=UPI00336AAFF8
MEVGQRLKRYYSGTGSSALTLWRKVKSHLCFTMHERLEFSSCSVMKRSQITMCLVPHKTDYTGVFSILRGLGEQQKTWRKCLPFAIKQEWVAKKKMDERSFFGSLLHVCYAPEFETVQETREKLQDRRKYIAKATNQRDCFVLKKVEGPKKTASKNSEHDCPWSASGSHVASNWDPSCFTSSPGVSHNTAYPSGNQNQSLLTPPHSDNNCAEISGHFGQNTSVTSSVHPGGHTPPASLTQPRMVAAYNGIDRFMPRTTHLQERKRKREEGNKFSLIGTSEDNTEVVIGPQLPEIPKVDMDDESLNTSATLIRNKLKEVADSVSTSVEKPESSSAKPLVKQRRRI